MRNNSFYKQSLFVIVALFLCSFFSLACFAASENVETVVTQLQTLQRIDVDPAWPADVTVHANNIQTMLDNYKKCSDTEKKEFTTEQNKALKAYFIGLYTLQNKDSKEVEALFTTAALKETSSSSSSSSAKPVSSSSSRSVSKPTSSASSIVSSVTSAESSKTNTSSLSQAQNSSQPTVSSAASTTPEASKVETITAVTSSTSSIVPNSTHLSHLPEYPSGSGLSGLFGNEAMGGTLLLFLAVFSVIIFFNFLVALRKAGKPSQTALAFDMRAQELFGEIYEDEIGLPNDSIDSPENKHKFIQHTPHASSKKRSSKQEKKNKKQVLTPPEITPSVQSNSASITNSNEAEKVGFTASSKVTTPLIVPAEKKSVVPPVQRDGKLKRIKFEMHHSDDISSIDD